MKILLSLDEPATRLSLDLAYQTKRCGHTEVSLEEDLFQPLQRPLNRASARDRRNIGQRYILYFRPERTGRYVARALQYPAGHLLLLVSGTKKNPDLEVRVEDKSQQVIASFTLRPLWYGTH